MSQSIRRFYFLFFLFLFLVTVPVIVLYAKGYRFDTISRIFVYSGSVTVESWPRDIDVYLDGKKQDKKRLDVINNSYTINGVRPGKHTIRCSKDGYSSWEKKIDVHSGISTEFWNVILFPIEKAEPKIFESQNNIVQFFISPRNKNEVIIFSENEDSRVVSLVDIEKETEEEIYKTSEYAFINSEEKENIEWSSDKKSILIPFADEGGNKTFVVARIKKDQIKNDFDLREFFTQTTEDGNGNKNNLEQIKEAETRATETELNEGKKEEADYRFENVRWMFNKNDELVVLTKSHELFYIDINKPKEKIKIDKQVSGFDFAGNRIYYSQLPNNFVWEIENDKIETKRQVTTMPIENSSEENFVDLTVYDEQRIAIVTRQGEFFIYNENKDKGNAFAEKVADRIVGIQFSDDGKKILYWSNNEIWNLMLRKWEVQPTRNENEKIFISRFSSPIKNVQWMNDYENLIFSVDKTIKSTELDNRNRPNITDVHQEKNNIKERDVIYDKEIGILFSKTNQNNKTVLRSVLLVDEDGFLGF